MLLSFSGLYGNKKIFMTEGRVGSFVSYVHQNMPRTTTHSTSWARMSSLAGAKNCRKFSSMAVDHVDG